MRADTLKTVCRMGAQRAITQARANPNCALATVMVRTAAGSRSAAPETMSGTTRRAHLVGGCESGIGWPGNCCARVLIRAAKNAGQRSCWVRWQQVSECWLKSNQALTNGQTRVPGALLDEVGLQLAFNFGQLQVLALIQAI